MAAERIIRLQKTLTADGTTVSFLWPGGPGAMAVQGDMGGGTVSLVARLDKNAGGTFGVVTSTTGLPAQIAGVTDDSEVVGLEFVLPECLVAVTLASATSPDCEVVVETNTPWQMYR